VLYVDTREMNGELKVLRGRRKPCRCTMSSNALNVIRWRLTLDYPPKVMNRRDCFDELPPHEVPFTIFVSIANELPPIFPVI
jgi:hypothetical protein